MKTRLALMCVATLAALPALGYVGPGMGLGVLGVILGLLATVFLAIVGLFWYPIKRRFKKEDPTDSAEEADEDAAPATVMESAEPAQQ